MANFDQETVITEVGKRPPPASPGNDSLVVIYAKDEGLRGKRFKLEKSPLTIGRIQDSDIVLDDDAVSRRHAQIEQRESAWFVVDVGSRNGTLHNEAELQREAPLGHGDRIKVGSTIFKYLTGADAESAYFEEVFKLTITDGLTQVNNRRHFDETLEREYLRARRHRRPLSLLVLDIDHFKKSTTSTGTWLATTSCASWRVWFRAACAATRPWRATAVKSSSCSCPRPPSRVPSPWPRTCGPASPPTASCSRTPTSRSR